MLENTLQRVGRMLELVASLRPEDHLRMSSARRDPRALESLHASMTPGNFLRDVRARAAAALTSTTIAAPWQNAATTARVR